VKVAVIGLGKVGLPLASIIADSGLEVVGLDLDEEKCYMINKGINPLKGEPGLDELIKIYGGKRIKATTKWEDVKDCNLYIVIVPLNGFDLSNLEGVFRNLGKILKKGDIVVLETTVPVFTTEIYVKSWLEEESSMSLGDFYLAYSPERIMVGYSLSRLKEFPKVIGGVDKVSGERAYEAYKRFIPNLHLVSSSRVAEFIKLMEGCYRDVNIALANELYKIADELGIDFYEARYFANHRYCNIHLPSTGVGGHCIPLYPLFLIREMEKRGKEAKLLSLAREINDNMVNYWLEKIVLEVLKFNRPFKEVKICIKGITYREGVKDISNSRNLLLAKKLLDKGFKVFVYDELFTKEEVEALGFNHIRPEEADIVFDSFKLKIYKVNNSD